MYGLAALSFFCLKYLHPALDLPQYVAERQIAFTEVDKQAGSTIPTNALLPTFESFANNTLQALNHTLMRPYLTESKTVLYIPAALEIFIYEILLIAYIFWGKRKVSLPAFIYFCMFLTLSSNLLIGYTIPIIGAFARYRSIYFPFIITPLCCLIDVKRLNSIIHYFKK